MVKASRENRQSHVGSKSLKNCSYVFLKPCTNCALKKFDFAPFQKCDIYNPITLKKKKKKALALEKRTSLEMYLEYHFAFCLKSTKLQLYLKETFKNCT